MEGAVCVQLSCLQGLVWSDIVVANLVNRNDRGVLTLESSDDLLSLSRAMR